MVWVWLAQPRQSSFSAPRAPRHHDFRALDTETPAKEAKAEWLRSMAAKLACDEGRALYKLR